jgi:undecaprenyl-diphosphatase
LGVTARPTSYIGASLAVFTAAVALARRRSIHPADAKLFRALNRLPDRLHVAVWPVMQAGSLAAVPISAAVVARFGSKRLAMRMGAAGLAAWLAGKAAKPLANRERPAAYLDDVKVRGAPQSGRGFPSGHAAVSTALTLAFAADAKPAVRVASGAVAVTVTAARIYVGAHFPLDAVGGVALGVMVGSVASVVGTRGH